MPFVLHLRRHRHTKKDEHSSRMACGAPSGSGKSYDAQKPKASVSAWGPSHAVRSCRSPLPLVPPELANREPSAFGATCGLWHPELRRVMGLGLSLDFQF